MQFTEEQKLSLLIRSTHSSTPETVKGIHQVLGEKLGYSREKIVELCQQDEAIICESCDTNMVESVRTALQGVGAAVEVINHITRPASQPATEDNGSPWYAPSSSDVSTFFNKYVNGFHATMKRIDISQVKDLIEGLLEARAKDKQIFIVGNGGSASLASHFATDLIKERFPDPRYLFRVTSLADNASVITATGNDFGYENIFSQQLKPWLREDDIVIAISSSGNSPNIIKALELAREVGAKSYGLFGFDGGKGALLADNLVHIPCKKGQYGFAEDASSLLVHLVTVMIYEHDRENFELSHR